MDNMLSPDRQRQILARAMRHEDSHVALSHFKEAHPELANKIGRTSISESDFIKHLKTAGHDHREVEKFLREE